MTQECPHAHLPMKRRNEVLVGILLTIGVVIAVLGTIWLVRGGFSSGYPLYARFNWGAGVKQGSRCASPACRSASWRTSSSTRTGTLLMTMTIEDDYARPAQLARAYVQPVGIFGDQEIALIPKEPSPIFFAEGDSVPPRCRSPDCPSSRRARTRSPSGSTTSRRRCSSSSCRAAASRTCARRSRASTSWPASSATIAAEQSRQLTLTQAQFRNDGRGDRLRAARLDDAQPAARRRATSPRSPTRCAARRSSSTRCWRRLTRATARSASC